MRLTEVRQALAATADSVGYSAKSDCFVAKRSYFYRQGMTAERLALSVTAAMPVEIKVMATTDNWHAWPADSFFEVRFRVR